MHGAKAGGGPKLAGVAPRVGRHMRRRILCRGAARTATTRCRNKGVRTPGVRRREAKVRRGAARAALRVIVIARPAPPAANLRHPPARVQRHVRGRLAAAERRAAGRWHKAGRVRIGGAVPARTMGIATAAFGTRAPCVCIQSSTVHGNGQCGRRTDAEEVRGCCNSISVRLWCSRYPPGVAPCCSWLAVGAWC